MVLVVENQKAIIQKNILVDMISESDIISITKVVSMTNPQDDSHNEGHRYKHIETFHTKGTWLVRERTRIVIMCDTCGDVKVIDLRKHDDLYSMQ